MKGSLRGSTNDDRQSEAGSASDSPVRGTQDDETGSTKVHGNRRHGESRTSLYLTWINLRRRCRDPDHAGYENYGGRGITVCAQWTDSYEAFRDYIQDNLGPRPFRYSLDRIDNDGNYEPGNVRWASSRTQARNQRRGPRGPYRRGHADPSA